jgi:hypothetical protein
MKPLSHHEIVGWIEPFARRGRQADLAASDRAARRLVFRPVEHPGVVPDAPALQDRLELESREDGGFRLTRAVTLPDGAVATLGAEGEDAAALLAAIEAIPAARQVVVGAGYQVALDHELEPGEGEPAARLRFARAVARFDGFELRVALASTQPGMPANVELRALPARALQLPQDLLAVLGWSWTRLSEYGDHWRGELRLRGRGLERSRNAEQHALRAAQHLAATFAEPPARFHERQLAARWRVTLRRAVPLLVCIALLAGAAAVPRLLLEQDAAMRMLLFNAPPLLLIVIFCLPEVPRIEFPPLPRRLAAPTWRDPGA